MPRQLSPVVNVVAVWNGVVLPNAVTVTHTTTVNDPGSGLPDMVAQATTNGITVEGSITLSPVDGNMTLPGPTDAQSALNNMRTVLTAQLLRQVMLTTQLGSVS